MISQNRHYALGILTVLSLFLLNACGGSGNDNNNPNNPPVSRSEWDQMVWDTDNWG